MRTKGADGKQDLPQKLNLDDLTPFIPKVKNCYIFHERGAQRLRAFYLTASGFRSSVSANIPKYGKHEAAKKVIAWSWQRHKAFTGEECPWSGIEAA